MLTPEQISHYHEHGYVIPDFQMPEDVLSRIKDHHAALVERRPDFRNYCPALLDQDDAFVDFCDNAEILDMVEQLIGQDVALWNSSFFAKPALNGQRTPWHQDGKFWPIRPLATCTAWLAVDDATIENGCLRIIRGSHKDQAIKAHNALNEDADVTLFEELDPSTYDEADAVDLVLKAGQISLHDVYLLHGSEANASPNARRGMTMRFMPTTSLFDREIAAADAKARNIVDHSMRPVYLMRGEDKHGGNQLISR
jgi:hypothetical protein